MTPKSTEEPQVQLFKSRLDNMIDMDHELVLLANKLNWKVFEKLLGEVYIPDRGRPGLPTRLMVGLHYLKGLHDLSDEETAEGFLENPYWQYFCGMEYFVTKLPFDVSSMTRWRKRAGSRGLEAMLKETIQTALAVKCIKKNDLKKIIIDTTVQEKDIAFPTDIKLCATGIKLLTREAKELGIQLRQTYSSVVPKLQRLNWQSARSRKYKQAAACVKKVRTLLGRVVRDIERKATENQLAGKLGELLAMGRKVIEQKRDSKNKIYSWFEPDTACIAKGKECRKYEFGCKASVAVTNRHSFIVGMQTYTGCPNDVTTLKPALEQVMRLTGVMPEEIGCDKGYRGKARHAEIPGRILIPGTGQQVSVKEKRRMRRRNAIEPVIGHLKADYGLERNYLKGTVGDVINALLAACGSNLKKLLKHLRTFLYLVINWLIPDINTTAERNQPIYCNC